MTAETRAAAGNRRGGGKGGGRGILGAWRSGRGAAKPSARGFQGGEGRALLRRPRPRPAPRRVCACARARLGSRGSSAPPRPGPTRRGGVWPGGRRSPVGSAVGGQATLGSGEGIYARQNAARIDSQRRPCSVSSSVKWKKSISPPSRLIEATNALVTLRSFFSVVRIQGRRVHQHFSDPPSPWVKCLSSRFSKCGLSRTLIANKA